VLLGHDELDLVLGPDGHLEAAQVHPLEVGKGFLRVPRAAAGPRDARGPGRLVLVDFVAGHLLAGFLRPVPARVC
jgi:hypothetical protein